MKEKNNTILKEPINFTDPFVLHDSSLKTTGLAQIYTPNIMNNDISDESTGVYNRYDPQYTEGMLYPIIRLNNHVINFEKIREMIIYYDNFLPTIKVVVYDYEHRIQQSDIPNLNNILQVIIIPEVNNTYKSISLTFKITSFTTKDSEVTYFGKLNIPGFNKKIVKELQYKGCSNVKGKSQGDGSVTNSKVSCNTAENTRPNTWEMLHIISKECGLGFSSTENCKEINDRLPRLVYNKNYEDFISQQMQFSGIDEESIFDAWIDLYGYLVMVNVAWVLNNTTIQPENLGIYSFSGIHCTDSFQLNSQVAQFTIRTLYNTNLFTGPNNMMFHRFNTIVNNSELIFGTSVSMYNFSLLDINDGNNSISQYDVELSRNSLDDKYVDEYRVEYQEKLIIECNDLPINRQKLIRNKFFSKYRQRLLEIELDKVNLGLQRGTLVNVIIFDDSVIGKARILAQTSNALDPNESIEPDIFEDDEFTKENLIERPDIALPNMSLTGMYYIDSMRFEYRYDENRIRQFIRLIKKSNTSNLENLHTLAKINMNK